MKKNQQKGDILKAEFLNRTTILNLGALGDDKTLNGKGRGDTFIMSQFEALSDTVEEFVDKDFVLTPEELSSNEQSVQVKHYGKSVKIHSQDERWGTGGEKMRAEALRQLAEIVARDFDKKSITSLEANAETKDYTAGLNAKGILGDIYDVYGEDALDKVRAIVIPSIATTQILNDEKHIVFASNYQPTEKGEIAKIFNKIPIVVSDRVSANEDGSFNSIVVPKNSLVNFISEDIVVKEEENILNSSFVIVTEFKHGITSFNKSIVLKTAL